MTEEVKPGEGEPQVEAPEPTEIEKKAMEMGWRPKDEFNGEDDDFIDAKEFVRRKPLFDKIEHQSKETKQLRKALDAMRTHYTKVSEAAYERAKKELSAARTQAIADGDGEAFERYDNEIKRVEKEAAEIQAVAQEPVEAPTAHPEFVSWTNKNPWYNSVMYMRRFADDVGVQYAQQGLSPSEVLKKVEEAVRKEFPNKFVNPNKANAPAVESGSGRSSASGRKDSFELTDQERKVMNSLVSTGTMTKEEYIADLKKIKGIK